jgi:aminoglycoside phosphotransferase family enzyme/predicted kinase
MAEVPRNTDQEAVTAFLARPESYGLGAGETVERIDTHGAFVFLAGERVYKIKRAVRYPYMDFSILELRRRSCDREVTLNRRTAPDLYLGVVPITRGADGALSLGGGGEAVEYAVEMRRFDQANLFDSMARAGRLDDDQLAGLARAVADFHATAEITRAAEYGGRAGLAWVIEENYQEHRDFPDLFPPEEAAGLDAAAHHALAAVAELLERRRAEGFVRHCHGDLHLRNICLWHGAPTLFDAIEFNDDLALIDTLYDLAFLMMDFEHRDMRAAANQVFNRYLGQSSDYGGIAAMPLFMSARAGVRAKTGAVQAATMGDAAAAAKIRAEARAYFDLAGSGKTTLARHLAPAFGAAPGALHVRSDVIRKRLFSREETEPLGAEAYTPEVTEQVYDEMAREARKGLAGGYAVVVDAVFSREAERAAIEAVAGEAGVPFSGLWLEAPPETMEQRIVRRQRDASDATPEVLRHQLDYDLGRISWHRLDAAGDILQSVERATGLILSS